VFLLPFSVCTYVHLDQASSTDVALVDSDDVAPVDHQQPSEEESSEEEMVRYLYCHCAAQPLFLHIQYLLPCYKLQVFEAYVCAENSEREGSQQQLSEDNLEVCDTDCMWLFGIPKFLIS